MHLLEINACNPRHSSKNARNVPDGDICRRTSGCKHKNLHFPFFLPPTRAEIKSDTSWGKDRVYPSLYNVHSCAFTVKERYSGVIIKGRQGQVILRSGTTQSKWSPQSASRGLPGKGTAAFSWFLPDQKPRMVSTNILRFHVLVFLLKASSGKIYIGRQEGIELPNLNEASFIFFLIFKWQV